MKRETLIDAYMKEYGLSREAAEEKADKAIEAVAEMYKQENPEEDLEQDEQSWWDVSEVICVKCLERWIAVRPTNTMLKDIECSRCKYTGSIIETGQEFYMEIDEEGEDADSEEGDY